MSHSPTPLPPSLAQRYPVLIVASTLGQEGSIVTLSAQDVVRALHDHELEVELTGSLADAEIAFRAGPAYCCVILGWGLCEQDLDQALQVIRLIRRRTAQLPILLGMSQAHQSRVPLEFVESIDGFIWLPEDSPEFIAGRIAAAARRYLDT